MEYNLNKRHISRQWGISQQIRRSKIDNKNNQIFLTTINSVVRDSLNVLDIETGILNKLPYYINEDDGFAGFIGLDTVSNRVFIQGKLNPSEVLVYNTATLTQIGTIYNVSLFEDCFVVCPDLGSIFIGGDPPANAVELDYYSLEKKNDLPFPETSRWKNIVYNDVLKRLYSFKLGGYESSLHYIYPPEKLDLIEYDISTGETFHYETTDSIYSCSYTRTLATTKKGKYVLATNSPENTISIVEISPENVNTVVKSESIDIYPNPTSSSININLNKEFDSDFIVELYNIYGSLLMQQSRFQFENNFTIDLTKFPKGQYFIHFTSIAKSGTFKIIKIK